MNQLVTPSLTSLSRRKRYTVSKLSSTAASAVKETVSFIQSGIDKYITKDMIFYHLISNTCFYKPAVKLYDNTNHLYRLLISNFEIVKPAHRRRIGKVGNY